MMHLGRRTTAQSTDTVKSRRNAHGYYWVFPLAAFVFWTATLLGLLLWWIVDDNHERYRIDDATVTYISNVGAQHQALFIVGTALTSLFYTLTLLSERWLRHLRRIPGPLHKRDRDADIAACVFGILGALALVLLACFNDQAFPNVHWAFTAIFVVCIAVSALCQTLEIMWLRQDHVERAHLRRAAIIKWIIVGTAIAAAIAFGATYGVCAGQPSGVPLTPRCDRIKSAAGVLEWFIAFLYDVYLATFGLDLWPARKTVGHHFDSSLIEQDKHNTLHHHKDGRPGAPGGLDAIAANRNGEMVGNGNYLNEAGAPMTTRGGDYDRPSMSSEMTYANNNNLNSTGGRYAKTSNGMTPLEMNHAKADGFVR
ncbi:Frag1/DRAM/Sfk1 family protein [Sporobolomyces salmoneus]|uniref:Frag1/DRAM/Sfk1 family protein n=1 Tax=Sporobolomyces salmoneus TaxID=183962 RepID=UPI00317FAEA7